MQIFKIVFTGGPCAGKTSLIDKTKEYLINNNYKVIIVPETATLLKEAGINLKLVENILDFQSFILKMQIANEIIAEQAATLNNGKVVILYDRGILDNKAYCKDYKNFEKILDKENISEIDSIDKYDLVFDLLSTATCAPHKYTTKNNKQREEGIEEAKIIDQKTSNAWAGARNIEIINSDISLNEAFEIIKIKINDLLNEKSKKEIKKYYLNNDLNDFYNYNDNNSRFMKIQEIKLISPKDNVNYSLYKRTYKDNISYIFKVFKEENNIITTYYDKKISFDNYLNLISKYKVNEIIHYKQLSFIENKEYYNIKFYDIYTELEYEKNKLNNEFILPQEIKIINNNSKNKQLLKK